MRPRLTAGFMALAVLTIAAAATAYSTFAKWSTASATFYVNPANADVSTSAAVTGVQYAMNVWNASGSSFQFQYGGTASDTATAYDNRNVAFFRNTSNGSTIATTYSWWDSNQRLLDSDIIFWDGGFAFFTGSTGCGVVANAAYLEDIATHELGHAIGMNHSSVTDATMYPSYTYCSQAFRTLASDDVAGVKALYPASAPANTAPVVTITSPANGATFVQGSTISLAATATDTQDGNISSRIQWTDNGASAGSGSLVSSVLNLVGLHTFVAKVTDNAGAQAQSQVSITITSLSSGGGTSATLTVSKNGAKRVQVLWNGLAGSNVDVYRNSVKFSTTANDGSLSDSVNSKSGTYTYRVCSAGTTTCTNTASISL